MKKVHKGLVAAVTCLALVAPIQAAQAVDDSAPVLTDFDVTPTSLDLRNGNAEFTVSGRVSDSAGVDYIHFRCLNRPVASRSLVVALSFRNDYSWGFTSMSLGQGRFERDHIVRTEVVGSSPLDTTNVAFSITASIPAEFNSVDCKWSYSTSDKLGNSYWPSGSEDLGLRFRVLDNEGFQYENPLLPKAEVESSTESSVKFTWAGLNLTADAIGSLPGSKLTFKVGRNWYISDVYDDTAFSESFTTRARDDITVVSFVDSSGRASRVSAFTVEIQPGYTASQKSLATFSESATGLTSLQRSQVKAAVEANPNAEKFICTGIRYYSQPMSVNIMVRKRAKAACDYAKELNPSLSTWYQNKPTQARSYAGKVLLTVKTPAR